MLKSKILFLLFCSFSFLEAQNLGSLLFHGNCTTCHFETKTVSAPSMVEVRENYKRAFAKKEDFVEYVGISKNPKHLSMIANMLMQGKITQKLQVASSSFNEAVVCLLSCP